MEAQYQHTVEGQEVGQEDVNLLGANAALADDRVLAELLRVPPFFAAADSPVFKAIMMAGFDDEEGEFRTGQRSVVQYYGGIGLVHVCPFRAVIGTRTGGHGKDWLRDIRTAVFADPSSTRLALSIDATVSNHRWDLVYARVDVDADQAAETRYVKGVDGVVAAQSVVTQVMTEVSIAVVEGTEAATPTRPSIPADGGGSYYIPLAYILIAHPSVGAVIPPYRIQEVAPIIQIASSAGGAPLAPCNQLHAVGGLNDDGWTPADGRPKTFLPPTLCGSIRRVVGLSWGASGSYDTPLDATTILDDSIDWGNRLFKTTFAVFDDTDAFSWGDGSEPSPLQDCFTEMSSTFNEGTYNGNLPSGSFGAVADVTAGRHGLDSSSRVILYVNAYGALCVSVSATSPNRGIMFWIEASGPWRDHGALP
jgi:hypothetical protein